MHSLQTLITTNKEVSSDSAQFGAFLVQIYSGLKSLEVTLT